MIRLNRVNKYFNKGKENEIHVVNDLSLELGESGMVAIFGKSGCGKTTLLNVIGGLDKYAEGSVTVAGKDGSTQEIQCDSVVLSVGYNPAPIAKKSSHVHIIGDAQSVGNLRTVIWGAWDVAMKI